MSVKFKFDEGAFRRAVEKQVNQGMRDLGAKAQRELDAVFRDHGGEPVDVIIPHLEAAMRRLDWKISRHDLTKYAEAMAEGTRVEIKVENVHL